MSEESRLASLKVDPHSIHAVCETLRGASVDLLLLDINDTCNAECVYCPNPRSSARIQLDDFVKMLNGPIRGVRTWQFGCGQEPTIDFRLPRFFEALAESPVEPERVQMITNGSLLHRYPPEVVSKWKLHALNVSIDSADPEVHSWSREATELGPIIENLRRFRENHPQISLVFSSVVHRGTIGSIPELLALGESLGVAEYHLREIFDHMGPGANVRRSDYRKWIEELRLLPNQFAQLQQSLADHPCANKLRFYGDAILEDILDDMQSGNRVIELRSAPRAPSCEPV